MKKIGLCFLALFLCFQMITLQSVSASNVQIGTAGETIYGDYVMIVNTAMDAKSNQPSGALSSLQPQTMSNKTFIKDVETMNAVLEEGKQRSATAYTTATNYNKGDKLTKLYNNMSYTCIYIGTNSYIWMEDTLYATYQAANKLDTIGEDMARVYEGTPYETLMALSNGKDFFADGSGKLSIFLESNEDASGYFAGEVGITGIHISTPSATEYAPGKLDGKGGLLVHEGQHAIFLRTTCKNNKSLAYQYSWLNEGLAVMAMDYSWGGSDPTQWLLRINDSASLRNGSALFYDAYRNTTAQDYSMPFLFLRYLSDQAGQGYDPLPFIQKIYDIDASGMNNEMMLETLLQNNRIDMSKEEALLNFYAAIVAQEKTGVYGFYQDPTVAQMVTNYPIYPAKENDIVSLPGTGAILLKTNNGSFQVPRDGGSDVKYIAFNKSDGALKPQSGNGTNESPYIIKTTKDLNALSAYPKAVFKLANDISIDGLYNTVSEFEGVLDGNGHTISNTKKPLVNSNRGTIKNLTITAEFTGDYSDFLGAIANQNNGSIMDCNVNGSYRIRMTGTKFVIPQTIGAIAGINMGKIERCMSDVSMDITLPNNNAAIGGILGENQGNVSNVYSRGAIKVVQPQDGAYQLAVGGLVGKVEKTFFAGYGITNGYTTCDQEVQVSGSSITQKKGKLIGAIGTSIPATYFTNLFGNEGLDASSDVTKLGNAQIKTDLQLQNQATYQGYDFDAIWEMGSDRYPSFKTGTDLGEISVRVGASEYVVGEALELYRTSLNLNGSSIPVTMDMLEGFDSSTTGTKTIKGSFRNKPFTFTVNVSEATSVTNLEVSTNALKTAYVEGELFDPTGLVLQAKINGRTYASKLYSGFTYEPKTPLKVSDTTVKIQYGKESIQIPITVQAKQVQSIQALSPITRLSYAENEYIDDTGLKLQITYNDGSKSEIIDHSKLSDYQIKIVLEKGTTQKNILKSLSIADHGSTLYAYYKDTTQTNTLKAKLGDVKVGKAIQAYNERIPLAVGIDNYTSSMIYSGQSENFIITKITGTLPAGITQNDTGNAIRFEGTPTVKGEYPLTFEIKDSETLEATKVMITLVVNDVSTETKFLSFVLPKQQNAWLPNDVYAVLEENEVIIRLPKGSDVTNLYTEYKLSQGATSNVYNGAYDFTAPKTYRITAQDNVTQKDYVVRVEFYEEGMLSNNANLKEIKGIKLKEAFDKERFVYHGTVDSTVNEIPLEVVCEDATTKVTINGNKNLTLGKNEITIQTFSQTGHSLLYKLIIEKVEELSKNTNLSSITGIVLEEPFDKDTLSYHATVEYPVTSLQIDAIAEDRDAEVEIRGNTNLSVGENTIVITVTSPSGDKKEYTILVTREKENDIEDNVKDVDQGITALPEKIEKQHLDQLLGISKAYDALSEEEQASIPQAQKDVLLRAQKAMGDVLHTNQQIMIQDLPWYVEVVLTSLNESEGIKALEELTKDQTILFAGDISLYDHINKGSYELHNPIQVKFAQGAYDKNNTYYVYHIVDQEVEVIPCQNEDTLTFLTSSFSPYVITEQQHKITEDIPPSQPDQENGKEDTKEENKEEIKETLKEDQILPQDKDTIKNTGLFEQILETTPLFLVCGLFLVSIGLAWKLKQQIQATRKKTK